MDDHNIFFKGYRFKPKKIIKMEIISFLGNIFSPKIRETNSKYIQLGCGNNIAKNFDNLDFFPMRFKEILSYKHIAHDLRKPLRYKNETFFGAFTEHTLEHLYYDEAINLLKEIKRILKPGSIFRCTVPDLRKYVEFYNNGVKKNFFKKFNYKAQAFYNLTQNYGHRSVWDYEILSSKLLEVGFNTVVQKEYKEGEDLNLLLDLELRKDETLYVECKA
jgi:predicted SAM-dependent methyltransferase